MVQIFLFVTQKQLPCWNRAWIAEVGCLTYGNPFANREISLYCLMFAVTFCTGKLFFGDKEEQRFKGASGAEGFSSLDPDTP